jgi:homogentisate 1,2-dioxygenase
MSKRKARARAPRPAAPAALEYLTGFGNEHETEALPGALPRGRRSPQRVAYGLYAEQVSGTAFTAPRATNLRSWFYRIRPSVQRGRFETIDARDLRTAPSTDVPTPAAQLRWDPLPIPRAPRDFVDGLTTLATNGDAHTQLGVGIHVYLANRSMQDRFFYDADGELLVVPQQGRLRVHTECGVLDVAPGEILLLPRGVVFRVVLLDGPSRGYVCENYGQPFRLPERGPAGSEGFANQRDFMAPAAAFEDREGAFTLTLKLGGRLHSAPLEHSPLDVVAWAGNYTPYKYDLLRFNVLGTLSYDQPDPSIYTVLTSPSDVPGTANADFVVFPPRWFVATDTFRPPPFHRNVMSEFMGLVQGVYDAKPEGFVPGGASLHNSFLPHGPAAEVFEQASKAKLAPLFLENTLAFMFESRYVIQPTRLALESRQLQRDYSDSWRPLKKHFNGKP